MKTDGARLRTADLLASFVQQVVLSTNRAHNALNEISKLRQAFGSAAPTLAVRRQGRVGAPIRTPLLTEFADEITPEMIESHLRERAEQVCKKTVAEERGLLRRLFEHAIVSLGFIHPDPTVRNPVDRVSKLSRVTSHEIRALGREDIVRQLDAFAESPMLRAAAAVMIFAGLTREEALSLTWSDIDAAAGMLRVRSAAGSEANRRLRIRKQRRVPISASLRKELQSWRKLSRSNVDFVLPTVRGLKWKPDNFSVTLSSENKARGLNWTTIDYRHTFGAMLAKKGRHMQEIADYMGISLERCASNYARFQRGQRADRTDFM